MIFDFNNLFFISMFVIPGVISMKTYDYHIANDRTKYSATHLILEAIMFSIINMSLLLPIILVIINTNNYISNNNLNSFIARHPILFSVNYVVLFAICPFVWTNLFVFARKKFFKTSPYKMAWDHYFSQEPVSFVLVHLNDDSMIGGVFADKSKVNDYPNSNDIYIEEQWEVDDNGKFIKKLDLTDGVYIKSNEYKYLEFFEYTE